MKRTEKRPYTTHFEHVLEHKCDICKADIKRPELPRVEEMKIEREVGSCYEDGGGDTRNVTIDLCLKCFDEKLIPWVESFGSKIQEIHKES